eukprot:Sspe_Gene.16682::Locus_5891_Transcript_1_1_Confidence_1.000_Length_1692::g.16682::m.16682
MSCCCAGKPPPVRPSENKHRPIYKPKPNEPPPNPQPPPNTGRQADPSPPAPLPANPAKRSADSSSTSTHSQHLAAPPPPITITPVPMSPLSSRSASPNPETGSAAGMAKNGVHERSASFVSQSSPNTTLPDYELENDLFLQEVTDCLDAVDHERYEDAHRKLRMLHRKAQGQSSEVILALAILRGLGGESWRHPADQLPTMRWDSLEKYFLSFHNSKPNGSPAALLCLSELYTIGSKPLLKEQVRLQAANTDHPLALYRYARRMLECKDGDEKDNREEGVRRLESLTNQDTRVGAKAAQQIWVYYYKGEYGLERNLQKAANMLAKCVKYQIGSSSQEHLQKIEAMIRGQQSGKPRGNSMSRGQGWGTPSPSPALNHSGTSHILTDSALLESNGHVFPIGQVRPLEDSQRNSISPRHMDNDSDEEVAPPAVSAREGGPNKPGRGKERSHDILAKLRERSAGDNLTVISHTSDKSGGRRSVSCTFSTPRPPGSDSARGNGQSATFLPPRRPSAFPGEAKRSSISPPGPRRKSALT